MKHVKHSSSFCSFCLKKVSEYCTNSRGKVICKDCIKIATESFKEEKKGEEE